MNADLETYNVVLLSSGANKIKTIKVYMEITGKSLSEGKEAVENTPSIVVSCQDLETCQKIKKVFENEGAAAEIRRNSADIPQMKSQPSPENGSEDQKAVGEMEARSRLLSGLCPTCNVKLSFFRKCPKCGNKWKV